MDLRRRGLALATVGLLFLSGCTDRNLVEEPIPPTDGENSSSQPPVEPGDPATSGYIEELVQETVAQFYEPGMTEFERAKAAFDYMIETNTLTEPVGLDLWKIRGDYDQAPGFVENRSLSILLSHIGMCEDYAAAYTMLLRGMGLEAEYVPGLTYNTQGVFVDHAWTVAKIDGVWYHIDPQLEQNISRHGSVKYKYFMRGDATMLGSHRWGQNLIATGYLTPEQNEELARDFLYPECPQDYLTPERKSITLPASPDVTAIAAAVEAEFARYEQANGPVQGPESNVIPPVFGLEGYGPQD